MQGKRVSSKEEKSILVEGLKCVLLAYIITVVLLFILALLLFWFQLSKPIVLGMTIFVYVISTFLGGFCMGKKMGTKKYLRGMLVGGMYFAILLIVSLICKGGAGELSDSFLTTLILCLGGGMLGGMVS